MFVSTNSDLANILGTTDSDFDFFGGGSQDSGYAICKKKRNKTKNNP